MLDLSKNSTTSPKDPYLIFNWQQNYFAISINYVGEVMNYVTPTPLPRALEARGPPYPSRPFPSEHASVASRQAALK